MTVASAAAAWVPPVVLVAMFTWSCSSDDERQDPNRSRGEAPEVAHAEVRGAYEPRSGDLVFQISQSRQSKAVRAATGSPYSHMGVVFVDDGTARVLEAVQPVRWTPLDRWIARGRNGHFVAMRLRATDTLTTDALRRLREEGVRHLGKPYDLLFEWSDDRMYCSEIVWKMYRRALGLEVGRPQRWRELDLAGPSAQKLIRQRGGRPPDSDQLVITPVAMMRSPDLLEVARGGRR